jgi:hypothetical protein
LTTTSRVARQVKIDGQEDALTSTLRPLARRTNRLLRPHLLHDRPRGYFRAGTYRRAGSRRAFLVRVGEDADVIEAA